MSVQLPWVWDDNLFCVTFDFNGLPFRGWWECVCGDKCCPLFENLRINHLKDFLSHGTDIASWVGLWKQCLRAPILFQRILLPGLNLGYMSSCDNQVPSHVMSFWQCILWVGLWKQCLRAPIQFQRFLLPGFESGIHIKLWHWSTPSCYTVEMVEIFIISCKLLNVIVLELK